MTSRERARDRGRRLGLKALAVIGEELRRGRMLAGTGQATVGSLAKVSRATEARYESGQFEAATIIHASELLAIVGVGLAVSTYPLGDPPRDARHAAFGGSFLGHVGSPLTWRTEVPLPNPGDVRGWDATISGYRKRTGVEFVRTIDDGQALSRRIALKRRDGGVDYLLVVVADTPRNRRVLKESTTFLPELPRLATRDVLEALENGRHPGDGLVLYRPTPKKPD